jgi:arylsulfatase A-like enzyme
VKKWYRLIIVMVLFASITGVQAASKTKTEKPMNVVFILADDLGWSDVTINGKTRYYETPNLERLAARGLTFNRAYAASPLCSPTRASILTGQTPARNGITSPACHLKDVHLEPSVPEVAPPPNKVIVCKSATRLNTELPTMVKLIHSLGYSTAHFGKWHLGHEPYSPLDHGFVMDIPHWPGGSPAGSYVAPWKFPDFKENYPYEHIEDRMAEEAVAWLRSIDADRPFYMNYWQFSVHAPFDAKEGLKNYYRQKVDLTDLQHSPTYAAMVHSLDHSVGILLDEIDRLGVSENTAIIFFSDNGGNQYSGLIETLPSGEEFLTAVTSNAPLRGGKGTMYEGGVRVPCIVVWPGLTLPGTRSDAMIQSTDFYPTILHLLGIPLPEGHKVDGVDITTALQGEKMERGAIFTYYPHQFKVPQSLPPSVAVHRGDWKLIRLFHQGENGAHDYRLYNLKWDIGEMNNLVSMYPGIVEELDQLIEEHLEDAAAVLPRPNPAFDPSQYRPEEFGLRMSSPPPLL